MEQANKNKKKSCLIILASISVLLLGFLIKKYNYFGSALRTEVVPSRNCVDTAAEITDPIAEFDLSDISDLEKIFLSKQNSGGLSDEELDINADCKFSYADVISAIQCKNNEMLAGQTCVSQTCGMVCYPSSDKPTLLPTADFIFGTESQGIASSLNNKDNLIDIARNDLGVKYIKFRLNQPFSGNNLVTNFSPDYICDNPLLNCPPGMDLDKIAQIYSDNNLSMVPMISVAPTPYLRNGGQITTEIIDNYVDFVEWFVGRYKEKANIEYLELQNNPSDRSWTGTNAQLLELTNKTYEMVDKKYPDVLVGTPGFEFFADPSGSNPAAKFSKKGIEMLDYFLDKKNAAKFDFLAFHGYAPRALEMSAIIPPNMTLDNNKYAGIAGMIEIRKKMDQNGWQDRRVINTEHTGILIPGSALTEENMKLDAAYMLQYVLMQRTAQYEKKSALSGIIAFKLINRCEEKGTQGECYFGSLDSNGEKTKAVDAVGFLIRTLDGLDYDKKISGNFDDFQTPWVEKFTSSKRDAYVFFKPFEETDISFDGQTIPVNVGLGKKPSKVTLMDWRGGREDIPVTQKLVLEAENMPKIIEIMY